MRSSVRSSEPMVFTTGRLAVFCSAAALAILAAHLLPRSWPWEALAIAAIAVAIWHGAFDGVLADEALEGQRSTWYKPAFYAAYLGLAAAVVLLWRIAPLAALAAFLLYSALHFGTEGEHHLSPWRILTGIAQGALPIAAACVWWPAEVNAVFAEMLGKDAGRADTVASFAGGLLWPLVAILLLGSWEVRRKIAPTLILVVTELALFRWCSPLLAFTVFFCLWHTPEHIVSTSLDADGRFHRRTLLHHLWKGTGPWLLSLAGVAMMAWLGRHSLQAYLGALFIVLSALTVPHMALAEFLRRRENSLSRSSGAGAFSQVGVTPQ